MGWLFCTPLHPDVSAFRTAALHATYTLLSTSTPLLSLTLVSLSSVVDSSPMILAAATTFALTFIASTAYATTNILNCESSCHVLLSSSLLTTLLSVFSISYVQRQRESYYSRLIAVLLCCPAAPLPIIGQAFIKSEGGETFTNATQQSDGALDLNVIQGDVLWVHYLELSSFADSVIRVGMRKAKELIAFFRMRYLLQ